MIFRDSIVDYALPALYVAVAFHLALASVVATGNSPLATYLVMLPLIAGLGITGAACWLHQEGEQ